MQKVYCYVDESGQDTKGEIFIVAVVLQEAENLEILEKKLLKMENITGKEMLKWSKTRKKIKEKYIQQLLEIPELRSSIYYSFYEHSTNYLQLTSLTIAKALRTKIVGKYTVKVIIDSLKPAEREKVRVELKKHSVAYKKIRGMEDEQSVFIRLADSMAGWIREIYQDEADSDLSSVFKRKSIARKV